MDRKTLLDATKKYEKIIELEKDIEKIKKYEPTAHMLIITVCGRTFDKEIRIEDAKIGQEVKEKIINIISDNLDKLNAEFETM